MAAQKLMVESRFLVMLVIWCFDTITITVMILNMEVTLVWHRSWCLFSVLKSQMCTSVWTGAAVLETVKRCTPLSFYFFKEDLGSFLLHEKAKHENNNWKWKKLLWLFRFLFEKKKTFNVLFFTEKASVICLMTSLI